LQLEIGALPGRILAVTSLSMVILSDDNVSLVTAYSMSSNSGMSYREESLLKWPHQIDPAILQQATTFAAHMAAPYRDPSKAPLRKLSVDLIRTYKHINEVSYFQYICEVLKMPFHM
jgi:hypothetical protein